MPEGISSLSPKDMGLTIPSQEVKPTTPESGGKLEQSSGSYLTERLLAMRSKVQERADDLKALAIAGVAITTMTASIAGLQKVGLSPDMSGNVASGAFLALGLKLMATRMKNESK